MKTPPDSAIQTVDQVFHLALELGASDVHFESGEDSFRIRLRVDGVLRTTTPPAFALKDAVISRLKILARMDIAERRIPQDGRIQYLYDGRTVDLRASSLPTLHGEKIVVRILNFSRERPTLTALGYEPHHRSKLIQAIGRPHGLILITGPTGSGKTSSLYSCLDLLNRPEVNISTVEDPSEIHLPGTNQVTINPRAGLGFANTLRALLRQDPDVIMVGEIRDLETAEIAIQAAQTGHLVLSTLHTNDAPGTLARLRHMGIAPFNIAASVSLITAQRLVRRLCDLCKQATTADDVAHALHCLSAQDQEALRPYPRAAHDTIYKAGGCAACDQGYKGRVGVYQVMPISTAMQTLILQDCDALTLSHQAAREGVLTLRQAGWLKVWQGITSAEEVMALTHHG